MHLRSGSLARDEDGGARGQLQDRPGPNGNASAQALQARTFASNAASVSDLLSRQAFMRIFLNDICFAAIE